MHTGDGEVVDSVAEAGETHVSGTASPAPPPGLSGVVPSPAEVDRAVTVIEGIAFESPDVVSALVDVAETECGWWLLAELLAVESASDGRAGDGSAGDGVATPERGEPELAPRNLLVESLSRATGRSTESVFETLHTALLPKLFVTDLVDHVDSVATPPEYAATVKLRSDADREFVSAVLLLVAVASELADGAGESSETRPTAGRERDARDRSGDGGALAGAGEGAVRDSVGRFSTVVERIRESSDRANRICELSPSGG